LTWEAIAGLSSAVVAFCALGLTIWQAHIARRHNILSVTPHLTTWSHWDKANNKYEVQLLNNGIGPAFIQSFQIQVDKQPIVGERYEPIEKALKILFPQSKYTSSQAFVARGYAMAANENRSLVRLQFLGDEAPPTEEVEHNFKRVRLIIEYSSMYEQPFVLDSEATRGHTAVQRVAR
jgi:hypothetical protein